MSIQLTKIEETASSITLGWTPVAGATGYRFSREGEAKPSHTWDATRSSVKFAKGSDWYKVEALGVADSGLYPLPPPPTSKPGVPTGLAAASEAAGVRLTWQARPAAENVDVYQVYIDDQSLNLAVTGTSYLATQYASGAPLVGGQSYAFRVGAHNSAGYGDWSAPVAGSITTAPPPLPPPSGTRDAAYWPFTAQSPWNYPIGSGASFAPETSPVWQAGGGVNINQDNGWSIPVFISTSTDPMVDVYQGSRFVVRMRVPANARPATQSDAHMAVISDDRQILLETFGGLSRPSSDRIVAPTIAPLNSPKDAGVYPGQGWHGTRAYGGSSIGGLIRKHEISERKIPHALAMAVDRPAVNKNTPNGQAFVWPASNADSGWQTSYGSSGNVHMGSLLAIPPSVDLGSLGLNEMALAIARAWQDYGGYICDCTTVGSACVLYAEPGSGDPWDSATRSGIAKAAGYLQVVTNNTPATTGGGGTPRKPLAPAFK